MTFVGFRLWVRRSTLKKFFADDYMVVLALSSFALSAALQQSQLVHVYEIFELASGRIRPNPAFMRAQTALLHSVAGWYILFYTGLWSVKISFLFFFRRLEGGVTEASLLVVGCACHYFSIVGCLHWRWTVGLHDL